jgi:hypothetical protein
MSRALTAAAFLLATHVSASEQGAVPASVHRQVGYAQVKLHFERNNGQADASYQYVARGKGYSLMLAADRVLMSVRGGKSSPPTTVAMRVVGGTTVRPVALEPQAARVNYLLGNDRSAWVTDVPTYGRVAYRSVYPGIDLVYYGNQQRVQYDFVVGPKADPGRIGVAFDGISKLRLASNGDLIVDTPAGAIRHAKPYAYQIIGGRQKPIQARFTIASAKTVGFQIGSYDRNRALVIDPLVYPVLEFATFLGGSGDDGAEAVATDSAGYAYVASWTNSGNFPTKPGSYDTSINGNYDVAVSKISPNGKTLIYSTFIGGSGYDYASDIVVKGGNAIVVGDTDSTDFPVTVGAVQGTNAGGADGFVTELNASGTALVASTYVGGSAYDSLRSVALAPGTNRVCVTGWTQSSNYPTTPGAFQTTWPGGLPSSAFATVLLPGLNGFHFSSFLHGNAQEQYGTGVAVDALGRVAVVGRTNSLTFPTTPGAYQTTVKGEMDAFITMFAANGASLEWSTLYGGLWTDGAEDALIDADGNVCFVGRADSNDLPMRGAFQGANMGRKDAFFAAIEPGGAMYHWGTYLGGSTDDEAFRMAQDSAGYVYVIGETWSSDLPVTPGAYQSARSGSSDSFVAKLKPTGAGVFLEYLTYLGGSGYERGTGVATDGSNIVYVTGVTTSSNFPTKAGVVQATYGGGDEDGFLARFDVNYIPTTHWTIDRSGIITEDIYLRAYDLMRTSDNALLVGETITFKIDGTPVGTQVTNAGGDAFLLWTITPGATTRTITTEFAGNDPYLPSSATATLTSLTMTPKLFGVDRTARITETTVLRAWLWRTDNTGIPGRLITFKVDGTTVGTGVTISTGRATLSYVVPDGAGAGVRQIKAEWAGDAGYLPATGLNKLTVNPALPYIWVSPRSVPYGGVANLYAYFRRLNDYQPQVGKTVDFKIDGTVVQTLATNASGVASYLYPTVEGVGTHTIRCEFYGDAYVAAGYGEATLTIY